MKDLAVKHLTATFVPNLVYTVLLIPCIRGGLVSDKPSSVKAEKAKIRGASSKQRVAILWSRMMSSEPSIIGVVFGHTLGVLIYWEIILLLLIFLVEKHPATSCLM
jgi:hypothetical protein